MRSLRLLVTIWLGFVSMAAEAAGFRYLDVPADVSGPAIRAAAWYPCARPPGKIVVGAIDLRGVRDCPLDRTRLPLIVLSAGRLTTFLAHHDTAADLANAGFVVVALDHPDDTATDSDLTDDLSVYVRRPTDVKRLIDFVVASSWFAAAIDPDRIGFLGFSRGGYTGLVAIGAEPDWAAAIENCRGRDWRICDQIRRKQYPAGPLTHDPRIKAAVITDPQSIPFSPRSYAAVKVPVQLWASEHAGDLVLPNDVATMDKNLPGPHEYYVVRNAGHFAFLAPCPPSKLSTLPQFCVDANSFDRVAFHERFNAAVIAFFGKHLNR